MCGIAGIMLLNGQAVSGHVLEQMAQAIRHRGPDGTGIYCEDNIGLLNTRLAIIDIEGGQQPFSDKTGNVLVANGEIYNDPILRKTLSDVDFRSGSDCETPLHLYARHGLSFARHLRGMYGLAIYDKAAHKLILSRDPYGIKQLYYVQTPSYFAFASEPQALIAAGLADNRLNTRVRSELLQLQFTTGVDTIFADIKRLLPVRPLKIENCKITASVYFRPHRQTTPGSCRGDYETVFRQMDQRLRESVRLHMRSDAPTGLFLSGGIDSSALLTIMSRQSETPVVALTAAFPGEEKDESDKACSVAQGAKAEHHLIEMTAKDFFNIAPRLASALDDPSADASALPLFHLSEAASQHGPQGRLERRRGRRVVRWL